jgi:hypothetical protein
MRDGLTRRVAKSVALAWFYATVGVDRLLARLARRSPFRLGGGCKRCAACCEAPAIRVGWLTWWMPSLRRAFLAWQRCVNGFELQGSDADARIFVFRCTHFDPQTRRCDSYASRPGMCRDYPRALLYQPHPDLLPGCGYRPIRRDAKRMLHILDGQALTSEQRAKLNKDLFLE